MRARTGGGKGRACARPLCARCEGGLEGGRAGGREGAGGGAGGRVRLCVQEHDCVCECECACAHARARVCVSVCVRVRVCAFWACTRVRA